MNFLIVGLGGFMGCAFRYGITKILIPLHLQFPIATLISNIIAGFFIGFFTELENEASWMSPNTRLFLTTGMMGGLSTFSTFNIETINFFSQGKYIFAAGNLFLNLILSFTAAVCGMTAAKFLFKKSA